MFRDLIKRTVKTGLGVVKFAANEVRERLGDRAKPEPAPDAQDARPRGPLLPALDVHETRSRLEGAQPPVLLDCREFHEWEAGYIDGAVHIPMNELPERATELDPSRPTIVYCLHGIRSAKVATWLAEERGFKDVASMDGGIVCWYQEFNQDRIRVVRSEEH